jgi:hypothetical protein
VPEAKQEPAVEAQLQEMNKEYARLKPEDLTLLDPQSDGCGSFFDTFRTGCRKPILSCIDGLIYP